MDTNYDQRVDFTKYYEADRLVRIERDGNNDGRVDEWMYYEAGKLDRIGYDTTGSGRVDKWERAPEDDASRAGAAAAAGAGSRHAGGRRPRRCHRAGGTSGPGAPAARSAPRPRRSARVHTDAAWHPASRGRANDRRRCGGRGRLRLTAETGDDVGDMSRRSEPIGGAAPRMALDAAAIIRFDSVGGDMRSRVINASRNGVLLAMPAARPVGTRMHVTVRIGEPPMEIKLQRHRGPRGREPRRRPRLHHPGGRLPDRRRPRVGDPLPPPGERKPRRLGCPSAALRPGW